MLSLTHEEGNNQITPRSQRGRRYGKEVHVCTEVPHERHFELKGVCALNNLNLSKSHALRHVTLKGRQQRRVAVGAILNDQRPSPGIGATLPCKTLEVLCTTPNEAMSDGMSSLPHFGPIPSQTGSFLVAGTGLIFASCIMPIARHIVKFSINFLIYHFSGVMHYSRVVMCGCGQVLC